MDCEKFESTLLDELYDELDEVTSAAAKRHVGGCARCSALLSGLKATRRVAVLPIVEPPADLEDRILAAAREAQKVVPLTRRASRAISWAGSWAMRPQTGMAAVFLLMTGLSALLLKGKHGTPSSPMTVSEQGEPVPNATTGTLERPPVEPADQKAAPAPMALAAPASASGVADPSAYADSLSEARPAPRRASAPGHVNASAKSAPMAARDDGQSFASAPAPAPPPAAHYAYPPSGAGGGGGATSAGYGAAQAPSPAAVTPPSKALAGDMSPGGFDGAMAAYSAGDYATATTLFDALAAGGDLTSALWAARSTRRGSGCAAAVPRFDQVARSGSGTSAGYDATFEGGQCYRQMGQSDAAQTRFRSLLTVTSYVDRAKNELAQMGTKARPAVKAAQPPPAAQPQNPPAATKLPTQAN